MRYVIYDLRKGLFSDTIKIEAKNPIEALKQVGYTNIKRDYTGRVGEVVIRSVRGSYVYIAETG